MVGYVAQAFKLRYTGSLMAFTFCQRWAKRWVNFRRLPFMCAPARQWMRSFGCTVPASCQIYGCPRLWKMEGKVILGERVMLNSLAYWYRMGQPFKTILGSTRTGVIEIGDDCAINGTAMFATERITIGKRVMIGAGTRIMDTHQHPVDSVPRRYSQDDKAEPVVIEDDAWIGVDTLILPGVTIGKGSVIGAKSVVTKSIPADVIAAGAPARVVRELELEKH